jgi:hypothetical protein
LACALHAGRRRAGSRRSASLGAVPKSL